MVRILMVSPYAPVRDGIGAYALQTVMRMRAEGHDIEVLSPQPSAAHHHLDLAGRRGPLALAKRLPQYDRVVVQYHPDIFFPVESSGWDRVVRTLMLAFAFRRARDLEVRVHEVDYSHGRGVTPLAAATRLMWSSVPHISVHTEAEREDLHKAFGVPYEHIDVVAHGRDFIARATLDRDGARNVLGLPVDPFLFLCIGFIQPHKGFDRAVRAFARMRLNDRGCRLAIVGSLRVEEPEYEAHLDELRALVDSTPGTELVEGFVSDTDFDRWILAADAIVLPYRLIWSSSVLQRAALLGRPAIATRVGGLADQHPEATVVDDDEGLAQAMADAADVPAVAGAGTEPWPATTPASRDSVMAEIRARAAARRGSPVAVAEIAGNGRPPARRKTPAATGAPRAVRRLPMLVPAAPVSARPGVSTVKRIVQRLTAWQVDPIVAHVNQLQQATADALDAIEQGREPTGDGG